MPEFSELARLGPVGDDTASRAERIWLTMYRECVVRGLPIEKTRHGEGFILGGMKLTTIAQQLWPALFRSPRDAASRTLLSQISTHLRSHRNVISHNGGFWVSISYHHQETFPILDPVLGPIWDQMTILERSKAVWNTVARYCKESDRPSRTIQGVKFWECGRPLKQFIDATFPDLVAYTGGQQPIYDFLRATTNCVNIGAKHSPEFKDGEHLWLVRHEWHESHTPITLEPMPEETPVARGKKDKHVCDRCGREFESSQAVGMHKKSHEREDLEAEIQRLTNIVDDLRSNPEPALAIIAEGVRNQRQQIDTLTHALAQRDGHLSVLQEKVTTLTQELAHEKQNRDTTLRELLNGVLSDVRGGKIGPMRALADLEDLMRASDERPNGDKS